MEKTNHIFWEIWIASIKLAQTCFKTYNSIFSRCLCFQIGGNESAHSLVSCQSGSERHKDQVSGKLIPKNMCTWETKVGIYTVPITFAQVPQHLLKHTVMCPLNVDHCFLYWLMAFWCHWRSLSLIFCYCKKEVDGNNIQLQRWWTISCK